MKKVNREEFEEFDEFDEDDEQEPDYYYCTCCNHTQTKPGMGNGCDNCGLFNVMEAEYF